MTVGETHCTLLPFDAEIIGADVRQALLKGVTQASETCIFESKSSLKLGATKGIQMDTSSSAIFRHRHNPDGSWDSICMKCYLTVATAAKVDDLQEHEQSHDCAGLLAVKTNQNFSA